MTRGDTLAFGGREIGRYVSKAESGALSSLYLAKALSLPRYRSGIHLPEHHVEGVLSGSLPLKTRIWRR